MELFGYHVGRLKMRDLLNFIITDKQYIHIAEEGFHVVMFCSLAQ